MHPASLTQGYRGRVQPLAGGQESRKDANDFTNCNGHATAERRPANQQQNPAAALFQPRPLNTASTAGITGAQRQPIDSRGNGESVSAGPTC